jgi:hypothetical protein
VAARGAGAAAGSAVIGFLHLTSLETSRENLTAFRSQKKIVVGVCAVPERVRSYEDKITWMRLQF